MKSVATRPLRTLVRHEIGTLLFWEHALPIAQHAAGLVRNGPVRRRYLDTMREDLSPQYKLVNVDSEHRVSPRTYSIPRRAVRESLRPRDFVKLVFEVDPPQPRATAERMWVEVTDVLDGGYRGTLANDPGYVSGLQHGDRIEFSAEHVAALQPRADDPFATSPNAFVIVSRLVLDQDEWPGRLERTEFPDSTFSGWIVLSGSETAEYRADLNNFVPVAEATLLNRFRVLDSGLEGPVGTTMIWNDADAEYKVETRST